MTGRRKSKKVTAKGAVELQENELDKAQGAGATVDQSTDTTSVRKAGGKQEIY